MSDVSNCPGCSLRWDLAGQPDRYKTFIYNWPGTVIRANIPGANFLDSHASGERHKINHRFRKRKPREGVEDW